MFLKNTSLFFYWLSIACGCFLLVGCANQKINSTANNNDPHVAFPGAEGFGKYTTGGRGGEVVIVSNLNDSGEGSFRKAVQKNEAKIIVFAVSGTIHLESPLNIKGNTTIAGQTAPGDGICIADQPVKISGDNVIIRYLRFRMGDRFQNEGKKPGAGHDDALSASNRKNIIIDHCSITWSTDEVCSVYGGDSVTIQWNIIAEPLNYSYHFEKGDEDFQKHGYGGIWGGKNLSAHHNLFAHCISRTPRLEGIRNFPTEFVDYRNNVIYNWGHNNVYGGEGGNYNLVNNYYKYGPATNKKVQSRIANPNKKPSASIPFGKFYVAGNYVDGYPDVTANNSLGVHLSDGTEEDKNALLVNTPFETISSNTHSAIEAYNAVLKNVGATFPKRDTLDERIVNNVINRSGNIIDVQGGFPHGTSYDISKTAWPTLKSLPAPADSDGDGMPDDWERKNGLNPNSSTDASANSLHRHFTNIEIYINSLVQ